LSVESGAVYKIHDFQPVAVASKCATLIKQKLNYSWKRIFRFLSSRDQTNQGLVAVSMLEEALNQERVFLTKQELEYLVANFGET